MEGGASCVSRGSTFCTYVHLRTCTENLRTRVRTLIDTSQNKVMKMKEVTLKEILEIQSIISK